MNAHTSRQPQKKPARQPTGKVHLSATLNHRLRARIWRKAQRAGVSRISLLPTQWVDVDSTVDSVCDRQEGAAKGYNPKKKGALSR